MLATRLRSSIRASCADAEPPRPAAFKAAPVPDFTRAFLGKLDKVALTEPEPFRLATDERHRVHEEQRRLRAEIEVGGCRRSTGEGGGCLLESPSLDRG